ncbi:MAG: glycosyltransferase [Lachnospiraceae bacterium]|nr:glycosyltransferase [Lachnospiraceae bacterium]
MRILYVHGTAKTEGIINALRRLKVDVEVYPERLLDAFANEKKADELVSIIKEHEITHVMSIHLIDTIAVAVERANVIYISLIWDAPYYKIFTTYGRMDNCRFSIFDKVDAQRFVDGGIRHVLYQPLAVDFEQILEWDKSCCTGGDHHYNDEVCFVGQLYDNNFYDEFCNHLPQELQDYFVGVFERAAFRWDGINRINGSVSNELVAYIRKVTPGFQMVNFFDIADSTYFENGYLTRKVANIERICVLNLLAERFPVTLYTTSKTAEQRLNNVKIMPPICSEQDLHYAFKNSKINLNISLKGIEGGTPQRVLDILGAGGFALTNYSPETAELFKEDEEIVMFRTPEELMEKVEYYLRHDEEREQIARNGHAKVMRCYTYEKKIKELLAWVEGEGR